MLGFGGFPNGPITGNHPEMGSPDASFSAGMRTVPMSSAPRRSFSFTSNFKLASGWASGMLKRSFQ